MKSNNLPTEFIDRLRDIVPAERRDEILTSFSITRPLTLRINTLKLPAQDALGLLIDAGIDATQHDQVANAVIIPDYQRRQALDSHYYKKGLFYSQSLSSQLAPIALQPQADEEILDLCAAPGGKTLQIACMINDQGRIAAVEKIKTRFFKLKSNIETQGAKCVHTYLKDGVPLWRKVPERFDRVLLDAPCSSESRFTTHDEGSFSHWSNKKIKDMVKKQKGLIYSAVQSLRPGGRLTYSTCSFAPEENEGVLSWLLKKFGDTLEIEELSLPTDNTQAGLTSWRGKKYHPTANRSLRVLPNAEMTGFFICNVKKLRHTIK